MSTSDTAEAAGGGTEDRTGGSDSAGRPEPPTRGP